jgi:hypothetical protein
MALRVLAFASWKAINALPRSFYPSDHYLSIQDSRFAWVVVNEALDCDKFPTSVEDFVHGWLDGSFRVKNKFILFCLGALCWALWKIRNKMIIKGELISSPMVVIHSAISLMQQWRPLLVLADRSWYRWYARRFDERLGSLLGGRNLKIDVVLGSPMC